MSNTTPLYDTHVQNGAQMVDFAGFQMPMRYHSQIEEHHAVRNDAGMFDVSHMLPIDVCGDAAGTFLRRLLANDVAKLKQDGKALYTCMLNQQGGILDDMLVYRLSAVHYRLIVNGAMRAQDLAWIQQQASDFAVEVMPLDNYALIAVQGPHAREKAHACLPQDLRTLSEQLTRFTCVAQQQWMVARTGYTGEDGYEVLLPAEQAASFWQCLQQQGVQACGLGARDTLRLEAGLNLYGTDMDTRTNPLESNLAWTVAWAPSERDFIGRQALQICREQGCQQRLVGIEMSQRGVLRCGQQIEFANGQKGLITSGSFSPTLQKAIAFARIPMDTEEQGMVEIRGKKIPVHIVQLPFVRSGTVK
jgi:aminomethyltransferase